MIEMLVVVSVIGILATLVLVSLGAARNKAKDTRIVAGVDQSRNVAEIVYDGDYDALPAAGIVPAADANFGKLASDISTQGGELHINKSAAPATAYAAYSKLNIKVGALTNYYCVDSTGTAKFTTADPGAATVCP